MQTRSLQVHGTLLTARDLISPPRPCPAAGSKPGRRDGLRLSPQGQPPPLPRGCKPGRPGCRIHRPRPAPRAEPGGPRGVPGRRKRSAESPLPLEGFTAPRLRAPAASARGPGSRAQARGEAAPGRVRAERGVGDATPPGGHVHRERAGSAAARRPPLPSRAAACRGPTRLPRPPRHSLPTCGPAPVPVPAGSPRLRSRRQRRRNPRPAGAQRRPTAPPAAPEGPRLSGGRGARAQTQAQAPGRLGGWRRRNGLAWAVAYSRAPERKTLSQGGEVTGPRRRRLQAEHQKTFRGLGLRAGPGPRHWPVLTPQPQPQTH